MTTIRPLSDRILVKRVESDNATPSGIIIPDNAKEKPLKGVVVAVGAGKRDDHGAVIKPDVAPGDHVLFPRYSGNEVHLDGEEHLILREDELLAIVDVERS